MDAKVILKNYPQQKWVNIFPVGTQRLWFLTFDGIENKHNVYRGDDCMKMFCESLRSRNEDNKLWKEENDTINKRTAGIVWKDKNLPHLQKKFEHKHTNDKIILKLKTIVIVLRIAYMI